MQKNFSGFVLILICGALCFASSNEDQPMETPGESEPENWVYGKIAYRHDLRSPQEYFMVLRAHPGQPVPLITGGYATTDVHAVVRLRGISTPRALQHSADRNRPHDWLSQERARWDSAMAYLWNIIAPTRTFRVHGLAVVDATGDKVLEADLEVWLGGQWLNLGYLLMSDGHARPEQPDGTEWDWGASTVPLLNPNVPK